MKKQYHSDSDDLEQLLWQAEQPDPETDDYPDPEDYWEEDNFDLTDSEDDAPGIYQNFANGYGRSLRQDEDPFPFSEEEEGAYTMGSPESIDHRSVPRNTGAVPRRRKHKRRRRGCGCGCLTPILALVLALVAAVCLFIQPPKSETSIGTRKSDTASILICGTDEDGTRTDTMMLLYLSESEHQVRLLSLPRDSYTLTSSGKAAKLNSAYGRNGTGESGMEALLDYVEDIIGYRPDGYILVDFTLVPQIVDLMGGVDFDVPMDMDVASVAIQAGYQHLNGKQLMTLLRFRHGYPTADLGRVQVQRQVLKACMDQWLSISHISGALESITLLENSSISSLSRGNYLWIAKTLLTSIKNFENDTLPGYPEYRNKVSYYILDKAEIAELINSSYNPYQVAIRPEDLTIAE